MVNGFYETKMDGRRNMELVQKHSPGLQDLILFPAGAMNGGIWLLQDYDHEKSLQGIRKGNCPGCKPGFLTASGFCTLLSVESAA